MSTGQMKLAAGMLLALGLTACGGGPSKTGSTACTTDYICQQYDYNLSTVPSSTLPDGFNLGERLAAMEDQCATAGGTPSDSCDADGLVASCRQADTQVIFTTTYYDPGLSNTDLCNLQAGCESKNGTFTSPGLTCGP